MLNQVFSSSFVINKTSLCTIIMTGVLNRKIIVSLLIQICTTTCQEKALLSIKRSTHRGAMQQLYRYTIPRDIQKVLCKSACVPREVPFDFLHTTGVSDFVSRFSGTANFYRDYLISCFMKNHINLFQLRLQGKLKRNREEHQPI